LKIVNHLPKDEENERQLSKQVAEIQVEVIVRRIKETKMTREQKQRMAEEIQK